MIVNSLHLENFRNYENETIEFCEENNIFYGKNGQGKTNIIEALYYFCTCKSFRSVHDKEVIKFGSDYSHTSIEFEAAKRKNSSEIFITDRKSIKVNGINLERQSELIGLANMVIFTPEHLNLIREGPGVRRNFIDVLISQVKPLYFQNLLGYYRILRQRNFMLKSNSKNYMDTIGIWNEKLADYGINICKYRNRIIELLDEYIKHFETLGEVYDIKYAPSIKDDFLSKENFIDQLEKNISRDVEKGMTLTGPHRDDFEVFLNGMSLKKYGSQGQTRTGVLKIKLAECEIISNLLCEEPVLLLDDVLSELDSERRKFFSEKIKNRQTVITCTDKSFVEGKGKFFEVKDGKII